MRELIPIKTINITLLFFTLFGMNTVENMFVKTNFEKHFALCTLTSAILIWLIVCKRK